MVFRVPVMVRGKGAVLLLGGGERVTGKHCPRVSLTHTDTLTCNELSVTFLNILATPGVDVDDGDV